MQGYQDIKITIATFDESWLQNDAPKARMWYGNIISELASKSYYHPLLTADKKHINFEAPVEGPNATLHSALQTKLSSHFRTMMLNSRYSSGTAILKFIDSSLTLLRGNKSQATQLLSNFYQLKWTPPKQTLMEFNTKFNEKLSLVLESNPDFSFERVLHTWIRALPSDFSDLQMKLNKSNLDDKWTKATTPAELFILTIEEMQNCNIDYDTGTNPKPTEQPKRVTAKMAKKAPVSDRGRFPEDYPTFEKLFDKVKEMVDANETRETIENKFKTPYQYNASCWLCRILPNKPAAHRSNICPVLKSLFTQYPSIDSSRSSKVTEAKMSFKRNNTHVKPPAIPTKKPSNKLQHNKTKKPSVKITLPSPFRMCYDTGTTPKSLCSNRNFFRELLIYDTPKQVALADPDITSKVLGQGVLDIIINDQFRIWLFAYYTENSDFLMSAVDHLSYKNCEIHGKEGTIQVSFPTFSFHVRAQSNFECSVTPGSASGNQSFGNPMRQIV